MKAIILVGVSASGKSTYAGSMSQYTIIERDDIRKRFHKGATDSELTHWSQWNWKNEDHVTSIQYQQIEKCAAHEEDIIISDTNLNEKYLHKLVVFCESLGYEVEIKTIDVTFEDALKRDKKRHMSVGYEILRKQWYQFLDYMNFIGKFEKYIPDESKPKTLIIDIDGTAAHMVNRSPYEWNKVDSDVPDEFVKFIIEGWLTLNTRQIVFLSGRDSVCRDLTIKWIKSNFDNVRIAGESSIPNTHLFMRTEGDTRKDTIVKEELFNAHVRHNFNVISVLDDRPSVVRKWHELGLKVWATGDQMLEF